MRYKKLAAVFLAALMLLSFSGCSYFEGLFGGNSESEASQSSEPEVPEDPNWPVTVAETEISAAPGKVACASPALAEYIYDIGLFDRLCAVSDYCDFSSEAEKLPSIGSVSLPNLDAVAEAAPEYILTFAQYEEQTLIALQQMDITVVVFSAPESLDDLRALYKELSLFFLGAEDGAAFGEKAVSDYDAELSFLAYSGEKKTAAFLRIMDYTMITGGTMEDELLSLAGFQNAAGGFTGYAYPEESWADFDPDLIFVNSDIHIEDLESSDLYKKLTAVKGDKVYGVELDVLALCSRRSLEIVKNMLATAYDDYSGGTALEPAYPSLYS